MENRLCSKLGIALIIVGSIFLLTTAAVLAASNAQPGAVRHATTRSDLSPAPFSDDGVDGTQPISGGNMIANSIALFFNAPISDVVALRADGFGFGEIAKVYFLAGDAMTDTTTIVGLREAGMGWGKIAMFLGLKPGNHGRNLGMIVSGRGTLSPTMSAMSGMTPTETMTGGNKIANSIALFFNVPVSDVVALRADGYGFGEIAKVYFLAGEMMTDTTTIIALREADMGWGEIAKSLGLSPGNHGRNLGMIISGRGTVSDTVPASAVGTQGQGNAYGHNKQGNQGQGNAHGHNKQGNQGQGNAHGNNNRGNQGKGKDK